METTPGPVADKRYDAYRGARVAITGGLGFVGASLARRLVGLGSEIVVIDNLSPGSGGNPFNIEPFADRLTVASCDIRDTTALFTLLGSLGRK